MKRMYLVALGCTFAQGALADDAQLREDAAAGLRKAVSYFQRHVATEGGYLWRYSEDLKHREGEGMATPTQVWVQPPGTPAVGMALLVAYEATKEREFLDAAVAAARCLARGQLRSGGWTYSIEFDPQKRRNFYYRADPVGLKAKNVSTLDDNTTQAALRLLMRVDLALGQKDAEIHGAAQFALEALHKVQYPNGAWPQGFSGPTDQEAFPIKQATFPATWSREWPKGAYWGHYTLNDNSIADVIDTLLEAGRLYEKPKHRLAALRGGDFFLLAQLPAPQPGWAQQYDRDMHPAWARKFEPPSITGGEAQGVMLTLLRLYRETGDKKYLEPVPRALEYYRRSLLPNGQLARFYELKTNKPLYFTKKYELTYDDKDLPTHYAFKVGSRLDAIAKEYERLSALDPAALKQLPQPRPAQVTDALRSQVKAVLAAQDERGRWIDGGGLRFLRPKDPTIRVLDCATFIRNVEILSRFLAAK